MAKNRKIKFTVTACKFFDIHGNTYHSVRIVRMKDGAVLTSGSRLVYGYGSQYEQTTMELLAKHKWIPVKYRSSNIRVEDNMYTYQRKNNYPISYSASYGLKRDAVENGTL